MPLRLASFAMGTRFEFVLCDRSVRAPTLRAAGEEALREINDWHARLNRFDKASQLSFISRTAPHRPVRLDDDLFELFSLCIEVRTASSGAFDITIAPAMDALRAGLAAPRAISLAADPVILDASDRTIRFADPAISLDLGGIAKGFALDRAASILRESGITSALLHGGTSTVIAIGTPPDRDGWGIAIHGHDDTDRITLNLRDQALSISAPRGRTFERAETKHGHIIDPRTGATAPIDITAAVLAPTSSPSAAAAADAWSTALTIVAAPPSAMPAHLAAALHQPRTRWTFHGDPPLALSHVDAELLETT